MHIWSGNWNTISFRQHAVNGNSNGNLQGVCMCPKNVCLGITAYLHGAKRKYMGKKFPKACFSNPA